MKNSAVPFGVILAKEIPESLREKLEKNATSADTDTIDDVVGGKCSDDG